MGLCILKPICSNWMKLWWFLHSCLVKVFGRSKQIQDLIFLNIRKNLFCDNFQHKFEKNMLQCSLHTNISSHSFGLYLRLGGGGTQKNIHPCDTLRGTQ